MAAPIAFRATPIEDRGFRPFHDPTGKHFERPLSRIVALAISSAAPMAAPIAFQATPIEDRGFRRFHDPSGKPFGATPIQDPGFWPIRKP